MRIKLPTDVQWLPIQALTPINGVNKVDTEIWLNDTNSLIIRVCAVDGDAVIIISSDGTTTWDGVSMSQWLPEYLHIPLGWSVYCSGATVNFSPCQ